MQIKAISNLRIVVAIHTLFAVFTLDAFAQEQANAPQSLSDALSTTCKSDALDWRAEQNRLLVHGKVNGKAAIFKIDTGALGTLLTLKSAKERELTIIDFKATFSGAGGTGKIYGSPVQRLELGSSVDLTGQRLAVIDLPVLDGIDGLIGGDTLASTKAIIDYRQHKFHIPIATSNPDLAKVATEAGMMAIKLEREGNYVFITLNRDAELVRMLVDTGAQKTLITTKAASRLKLPLQESKDRVVGAGENPVKIQKATIDKLTVGRTAFRDLECLVAPLEYLNGYSKTATDGILGADCLEASGAVLSIADASIVLPPNGITVSKTAAQAER